MSAETEVAWAAGFFDGEGSIGAWSDKRYRQRVCLQMSVAQSSSDDGPPPALLRFQAAVGGHGTIAQRKPSSQRLGLRPMWYWHLGAVSKVKEVVALLLPHLTVKVDQVAAAMAARHEWEGLMSDLDQFCKRGHEFTEDNTYYYPNRKAQSGSRLVRTCRTCNRLKTAESRRRRKALMSPASAERAG